MATALNYVSMDDVRPASEVDFAAEPLASSEFRCKDGLVVTLETSKLDGKTWARVLVHAEPPPEPPPAAPAASVDGAQPDGQAQPGEKPPEPPAGDKPPGDKPAGEKPEDTPAEKLAKEVTELQGKLSGWAFAIPDYKAQVIAKHMNDLLAAPPAVETPAVGPPAPTDEPGEDQPAPVQEPAKGDDQADDGGGG